jgi:hypothetical protein
MSENTVLKIQKKLNKRYGELKSWRDVAVEYSLNVGHIYRLAKYGKEPRRADLRRALELPAKCPTCKHRLPGTIKPVKSLWDYPVSLLKFMYLNREEF